MIITAVNAFELFATLTLQTTAFEKALKNAQNMATNAGNGIKTGFSGLSGLFSSAGEAIKNGLETAVKTATASIAAASAAVVGLGKKALDAGMSFDAAMSQVAATMGKTVKDMESELATVKLPSGEEFTGNLRDFAKKMGAETKYSATEAAGALNYMALAGYTVKESMEMMPNVLNLAAAGGMQLQKASDMLTDTQKALGLSFERTNLLVDEMAKAASTGNTSVEQLGEAFLTVGGLAKEANGGFVTLSDGTQAAADGVQEMEIAFTAMANAGVKGSEAGTHMRNMLLKLTSPTEKGTKAFEEMGISVFDAEGKMRSIKDIFGELNAAFGNMTQADKLAKISDIFNARDTASAEALLAAVEQDWDKIGESILNAEGAAQGMANTQLNNLNGAITILKSALEGVYIEISEKLTPSLIDFVKIGQETLSNLIPAIKAGDFNSITRILENAFSQALDKVVTLTPKVLKIAGTLVSTLAKGFIRNIPHVLKVLVDSLKKANTSGVGESIVTSIFDDISKSLSGIGYLARKAVKLLAQALSRRIPEFMKSITKLLTSITIELTKPSSISAMVDAGISLITALVTGLADSVSIITANAPTIIENIKQGFIDNKDKIKGAAIELWNTFKGGFTNAVSGLDFDTIKSDVIDPLMTKLSENSKSIYDNVILPAWNFVVTKLPDLINGIVDIIDFGEISSALSTFIIDFLGGVSQFVENIDWENIAIKISDFLNNIDWAGILKSVFSLMGTLISSTPEIIKAFQDSLDEKYKAIAEIIGLHFAIKFVTKILAAFATNGTIMTTFATIRTTLTSNITLGASAGGASFGTKFAAGLSTFLLSWHFGSAMYEHFQAEFDALLEPFWDTLFYGISKITGDDTLFNGWGLSADTILDLAESLKKPHFAKGGVVTKPTTALIGEAGDEVVMPLENNTGWISELAQRINTEIVPTVNTNPVINFDKAAEYNVEVNGELKISNLSKTLDNIENSLSKIKAVVTPEIKTNGIQSISDGLNRISETELKISPVVSDFDIPEIPEKKSKVKTIFEKFNIPEISDRESKVKTTFEKFDIPAISDGIRKISTVFNKYKSPEIQDATQKVNSDVEEIEFPEISDKVLKIKSVFEKADIPNIPDINIKADTVFSSFKTPEIADKTAKVNYDYEKPVIPVISDITAKIKSVFESFDLPKIPDIFAKIKAIFEDIESPEIPDIISRIKTVFDNFDIPDIPEFEDIKVKIKGIFEGFNIPEIPESKFKVSPDFEIPEIGSLQYTAQNQAVSATSEQPIVINELVVNMQNSVSNDYDVDRMSERFIRKLSDRIDTYKYRNRRGVGGTA